MGLFSPALCNQLALIANWQAGSHLSYFVQRQVKNIIRLLNDTRLGHPPPDLHDHSSDLIAAHKIEPEAVVFGEHRRSLRIFQEKLKLLAHLLRLNPEWRRARLMVRTIVDTPSDREDMQTRLQELTVEARIPAETDVLVRPQGQSINDVMHAASRKADVVFLGMREPEPGTEADYAARLDELAKGFHTTIFVRNAGPFSGELIGD